MISSLRSGRWPAALAAALYGFFLIATNARVTVFEDEAEIVATARRPPSVLLAPFRAGVGLHDHPPLSDLLLHFWLRATGERFAALRVPSIIFWCLALWILAEAAELAWSRRWTLLLLGVAWPAGYFLARPAGWYALSMLEISGLAWCYLRWRATGRHAALAGWTACGVLLVYTNYLGWVFLAVHWIDLALDQSARDRLVRLSAALAVISVAFLPLIPVLLSEAAAGIQPGSAAGRAARTLYLAHSLFSSEMAAPWTPPGAVALGAMCGLLWFGIGDARSRRFLLWLAGPLAVAGAAGVLTGARLALFGPCLLLFLASLPERRVIRGLAGAGFAAGWLAIGLGGFAGAWRYVEPWDRAAAEVLRLSHPGDLILATHPSFYFYTSYRIPWEHRRGLPLEPVEAAGRRWAPVWFWREETVPMPSRVVYVASTFTGAAARFNAECREFLARNYALERQFRYLRDPAVQLKRAVFPGVFQPEWRIELSVWVRRR